MKFPQMKMPAEIMANVNNFSRLELVVLVVFIIYLVFPVKTPDFLAGFIDSPMGYVSIFAITVYLFTYCHPILAILYLFVAYELLRRSALTRAQVSHIDDNRVVDYSVTQMQKDSEMAHMNPPQKKTLEEDLIDTMAPIGKAPESVYINTSFKPTFENVGSASVF